MIKMNLKLSIVSVSYAHNKLMRQTTNSIRSPSVLVLSVKWTIRSGSDKKMLRDGSRKS